MNASFEKKLLETATIDGIKKISAGAIIQHEGKILILKRLPSDFMPNIYELPGGGIEKGETLAECLAREVYEETGCTVTTIIGYTGFIDFASASGLPTRRFNFIVEVKDPLTIQLSEHAGSAWIYPIDARDYSITQETLGIISSYREMMSSL